MKRYLNIALAIVLAAAALAQEENLLPTEVAVDGVPAPEPTTMLLPGTRLAPQIPAVQVQLPRTERPDPSWEGYRAVGFHPAGYVAPAPPDLMKRLRWRNLPEGGRVAALELYSQDAKALRVQFTGDFGRNGEQLRVYDPKGGYAFGPYSHPVLNEDGTWWTTIIFGEWIGLEFYLPLGAERVQLPELTAIAYVFELEGAFGGDFAPASCTFRDVACEPDWRDSEARGVTMLSFISSSGIVGFCSGAALNRASVDFAPIIMTAHHCVDNQTEANNTVFVWNFQNATCDGTPPDPNSLPRSVGSLLLKRHPDSDWTLLGSREPIAAGLYLGWDASSSWASGSAATGIHHPGGTFKRISFGAVVGSANDVCFCPPGTPSCQVPPCFIADTWRVDYTTYGTQPGSSGSPVMDGSRRVRGTLSGGSGCSTPCTKPPFACRRTARCVFALATTTSGSDSGARCA
ncbi:MAG: hypothetical protein NZ874_01210 [Fimbriimonadales bacterium]|nr:hypothetical protein [Fimbriimonadales bacterium]